MDANVKIHDPRGPGRPRGASRKHAEVTRLKVYDLFLKGFNQYQIGESLGLDQSTVSHHLSVMRARNAEWFENNKDPDNRYRGLFRQAVDMVTASLQEAWLNYHNCPSDKFDTRGNLLGRVNQSIEQFTRVLGITAPNLNELYLLEWANQLDKDIDELSKRLQERRVLAKVNPLTGP